MAEITINAFSLSPLKKPDELDIHSLYLPKEIAFEISRPYGKLRQYMTGTDSVEYRLKNSKIEVRFEDKLLVYEADMKHLDSLFKYNLLKTITEQGIVIAIYADRTLSLNVKRETRGHKTDIQLTAIYQESTIHNLLLGIKEKSKNFTFVDEIPINENAKEKLFLVEYTHKVHGFTSWLIATLLPHFSIKEGLLASFGDRIVFQKSEEISELTSEILCGKKHFLPYTLGKDYRNTF